MHLDPIYSGQSDPPVAQAEPPFPPDRSQAVGPETTLSLLYFPSPAFFFFFFLFLIPSSLGTFIILLFYHFLFFLLLLLF